ncbi:MAG: hypothetical protein HKN19_12760 [Halioglobus sp.]|nr:hypothetical protein [Halioglobus sp.]
MIFLALVLALLLMWVWPRPVPLHSDAWFTRWREGVEDFASSPAVVLALTVLLPAIAANIVLNVAEDLLFGLPWIGLAALLTVYSFGRTDVAGAMARYRGALQAADFDAIADTLRPTEEGAERVEMTPREVHGLARRGYFYAAYEGWFAVVFWLLLLGPAAALLYRLLQLSREGDTGAVAQGWLFYADWLPARVLAASFTVAGDFVRSRDELLDVVTDVEREADEVLTHVGVAALGAAPEPAESAGACGAQAARECAETEALLTRTATAWVAVVAVLVVFG